MKIRKRFILPEKILSVIGGKMTGCHDRIPTDFSLGKRKKEKSVLREPAGSPLL